MPNKRDVITQALRRIGVLSADESPSASQWDHAEATLDAVFAEFSSVQGSISWALDATPNAALIPLADILAAEIAPHFDVAGPNRSRAVLRLRAALMPDNRPDPRDYDGDDSVTADEADTFAAGKYY